MAIRVGVAVENVDDVPSCHDRGHGRNDAEGAARDRAGNLQLGARSLRSLRSGGPRTIAETAVRLRGAFGTDDGFDAASARQPSPVREFA
jgi:hypothetical protein